MLSIILPTYNEVLGINNFLKEIILKIPNDVIYEIIVIDDRSSDNTFNEVQEFALICPIVRPFLNPRPKGLAFSILSGIEVANGDTICVMDSDGTHDPQYISLMHAHLDQFDFVLGSRFIENGGMQPWYHHIISQMLNRLIRSILKIPTKDTTSGFFIFKTSIIINLNLAKIFWGFGDYFYILLKEAHKSNIKIKEIPVTYRPRMNDARKSKRFKMLFLYIIRALRY